MDIQYLGHAGFVVEHRNVRLLMDPWFYPAFLQSWFPYPDNRSLLDRVVGEQFDYLYVSHAHEDHYDERLLRQLPRSITVIVPRYRSNILVRRFRALGFGRIIALQHRQSCELAPGFTATMYLDTGPQEDSGLLLDIDGFRFLDLNDCNTPMSGLPHDIDVLAAQYSGAMWYPHCYDYPADVMREKANDVRQGLLETLYHKVRLTGARSYIPSAGPACYLDPSLEPYNDHEATIFPLWENVADQFRAACRDVAVQHLNPGDALHVNPESRGIAIERDPNAHTSEDLAEYRERRRDEWSEFYAPPETPLTAQEIECYFARLQRRNKPFLPTFRRTSGSSPAAACGASVSADSQSSSSSRAKSRTTPRTRCTCRQACSAPSSMDGPAGRRRSSRIASRCTVTRTGTRGRARGCPPAQSRSVSKRSTRPIRRGSRRRPRNWTSRSPRSVAERR